MKLKFLLFSLFLTGVLHAQVVCDYPAGVNTSLVISEVRMFSDPEAYIEITNMGDQPVLLSDYKFGRLNVWVRSLPVIDLCNDVWYTGNNDYMFLPNKMLDPGKSFVIAYAYDFGPEYYKQHLGRLGGSERPKQTGIYAVADKLIHRPEPIEGINYPTDSVTTAQNDPEQLRPRGDYNLVFTQLTGGTYYLEHHFMEGDSAVIDQVGGLFDLGGRNYPSVPVDFAGVEGGLANSIAVRKAYIKKGNIDFANARGIGLVDSEWIPLPVLPGVNAWRETWWTVGNHGVYELNASTLEPLTSDITVDFESKKISVPWGTLRLDDIMSKMKRKPGVAWHYNLNTIQSDSLYRSARTGDMLTIYVAGNELQSATFEIEVREPTADQNTVVPLDQPILRTAGQYGPITSRVQNGILSWPRVTQHDHGVDTITGSGFGLSFDLRSDSLLKYLEKPAKASWEIVWVDGQVRPDLKDGDKLKVTSENGKVKEYYIQVQTYRPNTNADLSAITWPDIPEFYRGIFGWKGDTIPNFGPGTTQYRLEVPMDTEGIPALQAKTTSLNAKVRIIRAKSLTGTIADRTVTFEVTAEDDTIHKTYNVELIKEKLPNQIEPYHAEPFYSEFVNSYPAGQIFLEVVNPGNQPIDLRNYMFAMRTSADPYAPITYNPSWMRRYSTYIPGLKHVDEATWAISRKLMVPDPTVNTIIPGGGTFVMALINRYENYYSGVSNYMPQYDVQFWQEPGIGITNNWNEAMSTSSGDGIPFPPNGNRMNCMFMYKVLNDSIKLGLKPVGDRNDFEVIDAWGMPDRGYWVIGGYKLPNNNTGNIWIRKPHITKGNPVLGSSFGTNEEDSEWIRIEPGIDFNHISTPARYGAARASLKNHFMLEPSFYKSTVNSSMYKVSQGYGPNEKIEGLKAGVTVAEFLASINKEDDNQTLTVTSVADGSVLGMDAVISMNDKLTVVSADTKNTTVYRLDVTAAGLSNNAYLTSSRWNINVSVDPKSAGEAADENAGVGTIAGFDYGTTIKTIVDNVNVPAGAMLTVIDGNGSYVPYTTLNFDTTYVSVTVNPGIYFDVVAEDNVTRMVYQLQPNTSENDAFILSDVYEVSQMDNLIYFVPRGTNFDAFLDNIIPSLGAKLKLVDKMGFERKQGTIREDDKVIVTSANGEVTRVYFISFRPTSTIPLTTYLAYVLSEAYLVDQVEYVISAGLAPLTSETMLDEFLGYLMPSVGASVTVIDKNGEEKSGGDLNDGDQLKVTSADGKIIAYYKLALDLTATDVIGVQQQIEIFPNPTSDKLNIQGVVAGNRIQIYSASGALIREVKAQNSFVTVSLDDMPSGLFIIAISDDQTLLGRYKAIRK